MDKKNWTNVPHSRAQETVANNPGLPDEPSVDQLGDGVFGVPPSLLTGVLTGLAGTVVGGVSLPIYFFLREPYYFREVYCLKTKASEQTQVTVKRMRMQSSFGFKIDLDR